MVGKMEVGLLVVVVAEMGEGLLVVTDQACRLLRATGHPIRS